MKIKPYIEKLSNSDQFKKFKTQYPDAFMVAGFFIIDFDMGQNIHQIDYYIPSTKKFAAFTLDNQVTLQLLEAMSKKTPEPLDMRTNIDLDALKGILEDGMKNRGMTEEIRKIIAVVQNIQGRKIWNLNCVLSGMEILKAHVEDSSQTILRLEKSSLVDLMKKVQLPGAMSGPLQQDRPNKKNLKLEIKKLDELAKEIQREKDELAKHMK